MLWQRTWRRFSLAKALVLVVLLVRQILRLGLLNCQQPLCPTAMAMHKRAQSYKQVLPNTALDRAALTAQLKAMLRAARLVRFAIR